MFITAQWGQSIGNITGSQKQSPCYLLGCIYLFHKASFTHENKILIQVHNDYKSKHL